MNIEHTQEFEIIRAPLDANPKTQEEYEIKYEEHHEEYHKEEHEEKHEGSLSATESESKDVDMKVSESNEAEPLKVSQVQRVHGALTRRKPKDVVSHAHKEEKSTKLSPEKKSDELVGTYEGQSVDSTKKKKTPFDDLYHSFVGPVEPILDPNPVGDKMKAGKARERISNIRLDSFKDDYKAFEICTFVQGQKQGSAISVWHDGTYEEHFYIDGVLHGPMTLYYADGSYLEGLYANNKCSGAAVMHYANGDEEKCYLINGKKQGLSILTTASGDRIEAYWYNDVLDGKAMYFSAEGTIEERIYEKGNCVKTQLVNSDDESSYR